MFDPQPLQKRPSFLFELFVGSLPSRACRQANGRVHAPPTRSSGCTRNSSEGSRRKPCCHPQTRRPCCSGLCWLPGKSPCARSTAGTPFPQSLSISRLTSQLDQLFSKCRRLRRQKIPTNFATGPKRSERLSDLSEQVDWPENVWMGVSIESDAYWWRTQHLRKCAAKTKFLSLEPLLGPISTPDFGGIDWVIAGGESGPGARPVNAEWIRNIRDACIVQRVSFHFKQWGGVNKKAAGRLLDGRTWDDLPRRRRVPT
jgi:Protein of unknown function (DUF5131)